MVDRIEINEMMSAHGQAGLTVVDYVRRTASEMRMARDLAHTEDWGLHFARATGFAAMIAECPSRRLTHLREELDELAQTDPEGLQSVFVAHDMAQSLRKYDEGVYLSALKIANAVI